MTIYQLIVRALLDNVSIEWSTLASHSETWAQLMDATSKCVFYDVPIANQPSSLRLAFNRHSGGNVGHK